MGQHVEAVLPVVVPHSGGPHSAEWHRFHEQVDVHQVDCAAAEREFADEAIDGALVAAEDEGRQRVRGRGNSAERLIECSIRENGQDRPEDLVVHDPVVPAHRVNDGRVKVLGLRIGPAADDHLRRIDQVREARNLAGADDTRVVRIGLRVRT